MRIRMSMKSMMWSLESRRIKCMKGRKRGILSKQVREEGGRKEGRSRTLHRVFKALSTEEIPKACREGGQSAGVRLAQ